jgi:uncharacterized protein (DUF58 family)
MRERLIQLARRYPLTRPWVPYLEEDRDWTGAKNFFLSLFLLSIALVLALNGAAAFDARQMRPAAIYHTLALAITAYVTVKLVPALARGTPLRWLFYQVDYRFTSGGVSYFVSAIVIGLAAYNTGNNLLFLIFSSMMAGILISAVVSRTVLTGVDLELELPEHVFARQPILASLTLENLKMTLPSFSLYVGADTEENGRPSKKNKKRRLKKAAGKEPRQVLTRPVYFPYIPRYRHATQQVELTFPRRGRYQQDAFQLSSKFPFGFLLKIRKLDAKSALVVYPAVEPTEEFYEILPLISGEMESFYRGRGHDLYSIRDYRPGDSARSLDWKASAKAQRLKVREFAREDERRVELVLDSILPPQARTPALDERFERAVNFSACLAWHFYEISSQMKFRSPTWETDVTTGEHIIYDILHHLAWNRSRRKAAPSRWSSPLAPAAPSPPASGPPRTLCLCNRSDASTHTTVSPRNSHSPAAMV